MKWVVTVKFNEPYVSFPMSWLRQLLAVGFDWNRVPPGIRR